MCTWLCGAWISFFKRGEDICERSQMFRFVSNDVGIKSYLKSNSEVKKSKMKKNWLNVQSEYS